MAKTLDNKNYIAIADWMISGFDFNTKELLCYAIIYGFSQDGESVFTGSLNYLSTWLGVRRDNVLRYLNSLVEKGVIAKEKKSSAFKSWCEYKVIENKGAARNSDHIIISPWMINDLGLKDKELILYALIYGFSRSGSNSVFSGNNNYMAKWLKIDKKHVTRYTSSLIKKELIERIEKDTVITYKAIVPKKEKGNPNQFEYTLTNGEEGYNQNEYRGNQFEYTPNQIEEIGVTNLSTNNIFLNNLNNNLIYSSSTKNDSFNEEEWKNKIEYEGFYFSPKQFREVNRLVNEADKLSTTKDNILFFLGRLYDNKLRIFKIGDTEIYNLYGFVKSAFTGKITKDAEEQKELIAKAKQENTDIFSTMTFDTNIVNRKVDLTDLEEFLKERDKT